MLEAFAALEPGRAELTRVAHERGWTGVRLDLPLALRFAPLLARTLSRSVLVWTVDADHCRVSLFDPGGGVVEAARPDQAAELVQAFRAAQEPLGIGGTAGAAEPGAVRPAGETASKQPRAPEPQTAIDHAASAAEAGAAGQVSAVEVGGSPRQRHVALAALLGVPDTVPGSAQAPGQAPVIGGERRFRRQRRIRTARDVLHFASGFALIAALGFVLRGPWVGIVVALGVVGVLRITRFGLGRIRV